MTEWVQLDYLEKSNHLNILCYYFLERDEPS